MTAPVRRQLTLFAPSPHGAVLDSLRAVLDPIQHRLIPAHVTACRDEEMENISAEQLDGPLEAVARMTLSFGPAVSFDGHGILLPCIGGGEALEHFRSGVLGTSGLRRQAPHITLAHPRNPRAERNDLALALQLPSKIDMTFNEACLIEQHRGEAWRVLQRYRLK